MSLNTFTPQVAIGVVGGNVPVFLDQQCRQRAQVFDANGNPLRGNALVVTEGSIPPVFQCSASVVYFRHDNGSVVSLTSAGVHAAMRPSGAAVTIALNEQGV